MSRESVTSPYYIAYLDVLGYSEYLKANENEAALFEAVRNLTDTAASFGLVGLDPKSEIKSKTFSDNVLLAIRATGESLSELKQLSFLVGLLQYLMLRNFGLLTRGCIVLGNLFIDETIAFGEGLVRAVEGEKSAVHPRVIIDESALEYAGDMGFIEAFIKHDYDAKTFVDFFQFVRLEQRDEESGDVVADKLRLIRNNITNRVDKYCKFYHSLSKPESIAGREKVIAKHLWVLERFNEFCKTDGYNTLCIDYKPKLNKRLMKYDIQLM